MGREKLKMLSLIYSEIKRTDKLFKDFYKQSQEDVKEFNENNNKAIEEGLVSVVNSIGQTLSALNQMQIDAASVRLEASQNNIDSLKSQLDEEYKAQAEGQANNVALYQQRVADEEAIRKRALADLEKAQKREAQIQLLSQAQSITTAVANAIKGFSTLPIVGVVLGLAAAASIIATFASYKAQIKSQSRSYAEGTEYLERKREPKGKDTIPIMADEGERILSAKDNVKIPKWVKNKDVPELIKKGIENDIYKGGMIGTSKDLIFEQSNKDIINELTKIYESNKDLKRFFMFDRKDIIPLPDGHVIKQEGNGRWKEYNSIKDAIG
jgi:hypothetical protein